MEIDTATFPPLLLGNTMKFERRDEFLGLTPYYIKYSKDTGKSREEYSRFHGHQNRHGYDPTPEESLYNHCVACLCESVMCLAMGLPIKLETETYRKPDVGKVLEVKLISVKNGKLRVRPGDSDWKPFAGVEIPKGKERGIYKLPGWFFAGDAKQPKYWTDPQNDGRPGCWMVPQKDLHSLDYMRDLVKFAKDLQDEAEDIVKKWKEINWKINSTGVEARLESVA